MVGYTVKIGGVEYPTVIELSLVKSYVMKPQEFTVVLADAGDAITIDSWLEIYRDGALYHKGKIKRIRKQGTSLELGCVTQYHSLKTLKCANRIETNVAAGTQISNQIGTGTDITPGTISPGPTITMEYGSDNESRFDRLKTLEEIIFVTGYETKLTPAGTLDFKAACGSDLHASIIFRKGELLKQWVDPHTVNINNKITRAVVIGKGQGDYMNYGIAGGAVGSPEKTLNRKSLVVDATCTLAAQAYLDDAQNNVEFGVMDVIDTFVGLAYDVYDTIYVEDSEVGVAGNYRIMEIEKKFNKAKGESTFIKICTLTHITSNAEYLVEPGEGVVNDLKGRTGEYSTTEQGTPVAEWNETYYSSLEVLNKDGYFELDPPHDAYWFDTKFPADWNCTKSMTFGTEDGTDIVTRYFKILATETRAGNVAIGHWWDHNGLLTSPNKTPMSVPRALRLDAELKITLINADPLATFRIAIVIEIMKATVGDKRYVELDIYDTLPQQQMDSGDIPEDGDIVFTGNDVVEFKVDQLTLNTWRTYNLDFQKYIKRAWGLDEDDEICSVYLCYERQAEAKNVEIEVKCRKFVFFRDMVTNYTETDRITSENLVFNGSFEEGGWGGDSVQSEAYAKFGRFACLLSASGYVVGTHPDAYEYTDLIDVRGTKNFWDKLTLSAWLYFVSFVTGNFFLQLDLYKADKTTPCSPARIDWKIISEAPRLNRWIKYVKTIAPSVDLPADCAYVCPTFSWYRAGEFEDYPQGTVWVDGYKVNVGDFAGTYSDKIAIKKVLVPATAQAENLIPNGDFERDNDSDDVPDFWTAYGSTNDRPVLIETDSYKGGKCIKFWLQAGAGHNGGIKTDFIQVRPSTRYYCGLTYKWANGWSVVYRVKWYKRDRTASAMTPYNDLASLGTPTVWTPKNEVLLSPMDAAYAKLDLFIYEPTAASISYIDDVIFSQQKAAISIAGTVACTNSGTTSTTTINQGSWTDCNTIAVPDIDHEAFFVEANVVGDSEKTDNPDYIFGRIKATKAGETTVYYPTDAGYSYCPKIVLPQSSHINHGGNMFFTIPKNLKGWNLTLQCIIDYSIGRTLDVKTWVVGWGHSQHIHE
jgi:hypothetical protein